ncbi:hypothetical protein J3459_005935 [Metarhizium acridum]|nr:hypothetical protein J3459_005935 [Metarhizium acridum]
MSAQAVAKAAGGVVSIAKKQTVQSTGVWESIRKALSIDANRSNGVPLNPYYRNPTPGSNDPMAYDDPVTVPAGDIADNPYWKRDHRRHYPKLSVMKQADVASLLTIGSAAAPKVDLIARRVRSSSSRRSRRARRVWPSVSRRRAARMSL